MLVLRTMPDLSTPGARDRYHKAAAERGAIVCAYTKQAVYESHVEQLSIKAAFAGREDYYLDGRRRAVDDDVYLIINQGRPYESRLVSESPVCSIAVVFSESMLESMGLAGRANDDDFGLERSGGPARQVHPFDEHLRAHDRLVTPTLKYLARMCASNVEGPDWYEEQAYFLLGRMVARSAADRSRIGRLPFARWRTCLELHRRIQVATDYMLSCHARPLTLERLAEVACLGRFHFLRMFRAVHGVTPFYFLTCKRVSVAARLLAHSDRPVSDIAVESGFGGRDGLLRAFREMAHMTPSQFRHRSRLAANIEELLSSVQLSALLAREQRPDDRTA